MPDTPDRTAREAAAEVLREQARLARNRSGRLLKQERRWPDIGFGQRADKDAAEAARLEQVAAWLEGIKDG